MQTAIWWLRRDLRLNDNQALSSAASLAEEIIPVFILDPGLLDSAYVCKRRLDFLLGGLAEVDRSLKQRGSRLILRQGHPEQVLTDLVAETGAEAITCEEDYSPYARRRDSRIGERLPLILTEGLTALRPEQVLKGDGGAYTVFTPFSRAWWARTPPSREDILPKPGHLAVRTDLGSLDVAQATGNHVVSGFPAGERAAVQRLATFLEGRDAPVHDYGELRNRLDHPGTSQLSPYLRFGMISARQAFVAALEARARAPNEAARVSTQAWLNELVWREFYFSILYHFPYVRNRPFRSDMQDLAWLNQPADFEAWCQGQTGYPVVDAAMRQLLKTGWMHNRARMIVASFLVKDLLVDWRWGEKWFMQHLIDGDPAANNGGWQWSAGTGTDAAPYFRVFNPVLQSQRHDPRGAYIRRYVPELGNVPERHIHAPWLMPRALQKQVGCIIGSDYPAPIVDHASARQRALAMYANGSTGQ